MATGTGVPLRISSATATTVSSLGSTITVDLTNPLPTASKRVRLVDATFVYSFPNVSSSRGNNVIRFSYDSSPYVLTLLPGLYSVAGISSALRDFCFNNSDLPNDLLDVGADDATSFMELIVKPAGLLFQMTFDGTNILFRDYLGYDSGALSTSTEYNRKSTSKANLNVDTAVLVNVSFAAGGYLNNTSGSNCLAFIPLNHEPGSLIGFTPYHTLSLPVSVNNLQTFTIWLTNQAGVLLDTMGEPWTVTLEVF